MKMRLISLLSAVVMLLTLAVGCAGNGTATPGGNGMPTNENKAQLVVAVSPILYFDDGQAVVAYNDVKNAMKADFEGATLAAIHQSTAWNWMYRVPNNWKKRAIYELDNWQNGTGYEAKSAFSYSFNEAGTTSLASYRTETTELTPYTPTDNLPAQGLLLSVSGSEEEALTYTVQRDGTLNLSAGVITAVQAVAGVNTGFLAEDGTARSASVRILVNDVQLYSGTLCNSTAAADGKAVTSLSYGQLEDLAVEAGDTLLIAVKLNATANTDADQSAPEYEPGHWETVGTEVKVPITGDNSSGSSDTVVEEKDALSILHDYLCRFTVLRHNDLDEDMNKAVVAFRSNLEFILDTEVLLHNEDHVEDTYEIVIGQMKERPDSLKVYKDLLGYRANNANDFIVRRIGTKVYIAASNVQSLQSALDHFLKTFCSSEDGAIPADYNYAYQSPVISATVADVNIGNYVIRTEKYPSTIVALAAKELQTWVKENCGYLLPITPMTDDGKHYEYEIQMGPLNGSVKVERAYDTRFTNATINTVGRFKVDPNGYLTGVDMGYYKAALVGKTLSIVGGSPYAISAAMAVVCNTIAADKAIPKGFAVEGTYRTGNYALAGGYDLKWQEDFSYDTNRPNAEISKEVGEYWSISRDTTKGPTVLGYDAAGTIFDEQRRPGVYGDNWWIWSDATTGNGYLIEVTKKEEYGYDAVRLISQNKWAFRYGVWETRLVIGSRNGACSAVWALGGAPDQTTVYNEIDVYENFGRDVVIGNYHTWQPDSMGGVISHGERGDMSNAPVYPAKGEHFYDTFHSIGIEWTPTRIDFYWDDQLFTYMDVTNFPSGQAPTTIKFANGVGTGYYCDGNDPIDWMDAAYTAATGKTVEDFFEVQTVDYSYILQTSNEGKSRVQQSTFKFARSHPGNDYYNGYLSHSSNFVNVQQPK